MTLPELWQSTSNYKISTDVYEGPLDLLLHLIEQAELDITKLSLAKVTDQYLTHLQSIPQGDPTEVSGFLVIAAKLVLIKSSILLPSATSEEFGGEEDLGDQLARQLIEYKQFKEKALWLKSRQDNGLRSYYRVAPPPRINERLDLQDLNLYDLVDILLEIYFQHEETTPLSDVVTITTLTLKKRINDIVKLFNKNQKKSFTDLLPENFSRLDLVVTFLAILELIKNHSLLASQDSLFSDIEFEKTDLISEEFEPEL
ncbi:MAG: hypothetical protein FJZ98_05980 [Chloroflexi bacterium]|nr:hypothetical protein [Chloroflexota bacterium]